MIRQLHWRSAVRVMSFRYQQDFSRLLAVFFPIPISRSTPARYDKEIGNTAITREEDLKRVRVRRGEVSVSTNSCFS